jgi:hypothetical protein
MAMMALWLCVWGGSFLAGWATAPTGDGFLRGMNRFNIFIGWQAVAGMVAFVIWWIGRAWPIGASVRRLSMWPIGIAIVVAVLSVVAFFGIGN